MIKLKRTLTDNLPKVVTNVKLFQKLFQICTLSEHVRDILEDPDYFRQGVSTGVQVQYVNEWFESIDRLIWIVQ
jgi:hypothetical protein